MIWLLRWTSRLVEVHEVRTRALTPRPSCPRYPGQAAHTATTSRIRSVLQCTLAATPSSSRAAMYSVQSASLMLEMACFPTSSVSWLMQPGTEAGTLSNPVAVLEYLDGYEAPAASYVDPPIAVRLGKSLAAGPNTGPRLVRTGVTDGWYETGSIRHLDVRVTYRLAVRRSGRPSAACADPAGGSRWNGASQRLGDRVAGLDIRLQSGGPTHGSPQGAVAQARHQQLSLRP